jgi:hypothetical protein
MDSETRQFFIRVLELLRGFEVAANEDAHSRAALLHALRDTLPEASQAYIKHHEQIAAAFSGRLRTAEIDRIIDQLKAIQKSES